MSRRPPWTRPIRSTGSSGQVCFSGCNAARPQTSAPCFRFDVKDQDGAGNADDQIAGPGVACGQDGKLIIGTAVGRVSLLYQLFRILVSHDEL